MFDGQIARHFTYFWADLLVLNQFLGKIFDGFLGRGFFIHVKLVDKLYRRTNHFFSETSFYYHLNTLR